MNIFQGLKVIDLSSVLAGPAVGTFFAELGAEVIKIEHPLHSDVTRNWKLPTEDKNSEVSAYFSSINYKKSYLKLNLSEEKDHQKLMTLVDDADIVLMNFKKGDPEKLNITDEKLRRNNKKLIIGKISGFGNDSDRVAYDLILQAETGIMSMNGTPESGPVKMPIALIDVLAAHHLKEGLLLELYQRKMNDDYRGKSISVSLYDAAITSLVNQASNYLMTGHVPSRIGSLHPNIAPYGELFQTKDDATVTFAIGSERHFKLLCEFLALSELPGDKRFHSPQTRVQNRADLYSLIQNKIKDKEASEILAAMRRNNVPAAQIKNLAEVFREKEAQSLIREELISNTTTKRITSIAFKRE